MRCTRWIGVADAWYTRRQLMTIMPRNGRYGVKVWDRGSKRYRWIGSFETEAEAVRAERDASLEPGGDMPTVEQWGRVWLSDYAREAPATQRSYRYAVEQIKAKLGARRLSDVSRPEARRIANGWPRTTARVARTMWADAVRDGVCEVNPWTNLRLETPKGRKDIDALTEQEIADLADLAGELSGDYAIEARAIILTLAYTGMRPGELCAMHRCDVDLEGLEIVVQRSLDGTGREKAPKNGLARRIILPSIAAEAIALVPETIGSPYLFHTVRGRRLTKGTLAYFWRNVRAGWVALGLRPIDLYELRHACATMLVERGLNVGDVAFQLGHQDGGRLVMTLYGHPGEDAIRDRLKMAHSQPSRTQSVRRGISASAGK
jgi:integrase